MTQDLSHLAHIFGIQFTFFVLWSLYGFIQGLIWTGKKWKAFKYDEHRPIQAFMVAILLSNAYAYYLGAYVLQFYSYASELLFLCGVGLCGFLAYPYWQNGFMNMVYKWTGTYPYSWSSSNDENNGVWNIDGKLRFTMLFASFFVLFLLFEFCLV